MEQMELEIGDAAGKIWKLLDEKGALSKSQIAKGSGLSTHLVNQGIGWLAREGKLACRKKARTEILELRQ